MRTIPSFSIFVITGPSAARVDHKNAAVVIPKKTAHVFLMFRPLI